MEKLVDGTGEVLELGKRVGDVELVRKGKAE